MTERLDQRRIEKLITSFGQLRLLVVGDVMLDEYLWGDVDRVSPGISMCEKISLLTVPGSITPGHLITVGTR